MVCTTIRPTILGYEELYEWEGCASFVADHVEFEALKKPTQLVSNLKPCFAFFGETGWETYKSNKNSYQYGGTHTVTKLHDPKTSQNFSILQRDFLEYIESFLDPA